MNLIVRISVITLQGDLKTSYTIDWNNSTQRGNFQQRQEAALIHGETLIVQRECEDARLVPAIFEGAKLDEFEPCNKVAA